MKLSDPFRNMPAGQRRAGRALVFFLLLMLGFTYLSRALDAYTIPRVTAGAPGYGALTHEIVLQGETGALGEAAVMLPAGFPVREVVLQEGQRVAEGDLVAVLDTEAVQRQLQSARRELEDARLAAAAQTVRAELPERDALAEAELRLERARLDAETAAEAAKTAIARAESRLREAQRERSRLRYEDDYEDGELEAVQEQILQYGYEVEDAVRAEEEARRKAAREIEDAELALEAAWQSVEDAALREAAEAESHRLAAGREALGVSEKQAAVAELEALLAAEGKITADRDGIVTSLALRPGDVTGAGGAFLLSGQSGVSFTAEATKQEAARLTAGDRVELTFAGQREPVGAVITAVRPPEKAGEPYTVAAELTDTELTPGTAGTLTARIRAAADTTLAPLSALYTENSPERGYVFVLREKDTTMGVQTVVERLNVEILDRGKTMAAVRAAFAPDDRMVTASSRPLADGDRVRLESRP